MTLKREDLLSLEDYSEKREKMRSDVILLKKNRLIQIGDNVSLLFENRETIQYQVQEMLRIEKIFEVQDIQEELSAYNPLIPSGLNLKATMLIEFPEENLRRQRLKEMHLVEDKVWMQIGESDRVFAVADEDMDRSNEEKTSAVHFLRFEFTKSMIESFKEGQSLYAGINHPKYNVRTKEVDKATLNSLCSDFA